MSEQKTDLAKFLRLQSIISSILNSECNEKDCIHHVEHICKKKINIDVGDSLDNTNQTTYPENISVVKKNEYSFLPQRISLHQTNYFKSKGNTQDLDSSTEIVRKSFTSGSKKPKEFKNNSIKSTNKTMKDYFNITKKSDTFSRKRSCQNFSTKRKWDSSSDEDIPDIDVKISEKNNLCNKNELSELKEMKSYDTLPEQSENFMTSGRNTSGNITSTINQITNEKINQGKNDLVIGESNALEIIMADMKMRYLNEINNLTKCKDKEIDENYGKPCEQTPPIAKRIDSFYLKSVSENKDSQQAQKIDDNQEVSKVLQELKLFKVLNMSNSSQIRNKSNTSTDISLINSKMLNKHNSSADFGLNNSKISNKYNSNADISIKENEESFNTVGNVVMNLESYKKLQSPISNSCQIRKLTNKFSKKSCLADSKGSFCKNKGSAKFQKNQMKNPNVNNKNTLDSFINSLPKEDHKDKKMTNSAEIVISVSNCQKVDQQDELFKKQKVINSKESLTPSITNFQLTPVKDNKLVRQNCRTSVANNIKCKTNPFSKEETNSIKKLLESLVQYTKVTESAKPSFVSSTKSLDLPIISNDTNSFKENVYHREIVEKSLVESSSPFQQSSYKNSESEESFVFTLSDMSNLHTESNGPVNLQESQTTSIKQLSTDTTRSEAIIPNTIISSNNKMTSDYYTLSSHTEDRTIKITQNENMSVTQSYLKDLLGSEKGTNTNTNNMAENQKYELVDAQQFPKLQPQIFSQEINKLQTKRDIIEENILSDEKLGSLLSKNYEKCMGFERAATVKTTAELNKIINKIIAMKDKKCYIKRFRKRNVKIYRLNKLKKKRTIKISDPKEQLSFEQVFESLTQGNNIKNKIQTFSSLSSLSTNSSYKTDETKSEVLSTGSQELSFPQQRLRQGVNELCNDKSLIYERKEYEKIPECSKDEVEKRIRDLLCKVFVDLQKNKVATLKFRRQIMRNCIFKDGRLQFKPNDQTLMSVIKSSQQRSHSKFKLILYILLKIQTLLETSTKFTKREVYYQLKYLAGNQSVTDRALCQISCMLDVGIWSLNIVAQKGLVFGNLKILLSSGETINCNVPGTLILQNVSDIVEMHSTAHFILVVEKESIFHKLIEDDLPNKLTRPFILVTGKGFPDINTQLFLKKIWMVMSIPMFILVDADPDGINIMLNYRFGSVNNAHISQHLAVPHARWLGVYPSEIINYGIKTQDLSERELKRAKQMLRAPYIEQHPKIADELKVLIEKKYKANIEGLLKSDFFLSKIYLPAKFYKHEFI